MARKVVKKDSEYCDLELYLMMVLLKKWYNLSYRDMMDELNCNKSLRKRLGFKSTLRSPLCGRMCTSLRWAAGRTCCVHRWHGNQDSTGASSSYTYYRYEWVEISRDSWWGRRTVKHHVLLTLDCCAVTSAVTDGDRYNCSMLLKLTGTAPTGSGYLLVVRKYCKDSCRDLPHRQASCIRSLEPHWERLSAGRTWSGGREASW